ncbi:trypsin-like serine peptidase [Rhizobium sp. LjRoot254]|uniref:trypsin-like serine peptidase n=1 Tax=Rhizobium sp. LjRoot254 TaxID=3342297 RepID=UPI003ECDBD05
MSRPRIAGFLLLFACLLPLASVAQERKIEAARDGALDQHVSDISLSAFEVEQDGANAAATFEYAHDGARYLRVTIDELVLEAGDRLTISGVNLSPTGALNGEVFEGPLEIRKSFKTGLIYGSTLKLVLTSTRLDAARIHIAHFVYEEVPPDPQLSIFDNDDRENFADIADPLLKVTGGSVVFIAFVDEEGTPRVCSGFLINPMMVMTNDHCVNTAAKCSTATIVFDYLMVDGVITMGKQRHCVAVKDALTALDFAVIEMDQPVTDTMPIPLAESDAAPGVPTFLVQHPGGEHKQLAQLGCQPIDALAPGLEPAQPTDFTHRCDTIGGSSGSPILVAAGDGAGKRYCVTGLHHLGFDDFGAYETKNRAVKISLIATRLKHNSIQFVQCGQ